jgi:hypothetical protein
MRPTRRSQPYRKGVPRPQGRTLAAMLRGSSATMGNPQDVQREMTKRWHRRKRLADRIR